MTLGDKTEPVITTTYADKTETAVTTVAVETTTIQNTTTTRPVTSYDAGVQGESAISTTTEPK